MNSGDQQRAWSVLNVKWTSFVPEHDAAEGYPVILGTPDQAWVYGAGSDPIRTDATITIRIRAQALKGLIGFCLVSEDYGKLVSPEPALSLADGDAMVEFELRPENAPARIVVRNQGDDGTAGEVLIGVVVTY